MEFVNDKIRRITFDPSLKYGLKLQQLAFEFGVALCFSSDWLKNPLWAWDIAILRMERFQSKATVVEEIEVTEEAGVGAVVEAGVTQELGENNEDVGRSL